MESLIVVSSDGGRFLSGETVAPTLQAALDHWALAEPALRGLTARLENGEGEALHNRILSAPLPHAWQWLDGSAFESHGRLMARLFGVPIQHSGLPLMYQGMSHRFLGPHDDVPLPLEAHGIDFEGEFGVITDEVPTGVTSQAAAAHIKLVVMVNDWSLRALAGREMKTGFGWILAQPASQGVAPSLSPCFAPAPAPEDALPMSHSTSRSQTRRPIVCAFQFLLELCYRCPDRPTNARDSAGDAEEDRGWKQTGKLHRAVIYRRLCAVPRRGPQAFCFSV